jgi:hypothetical protein
MKTFLILITFSLVILSSLSPLFAQSIDCQSSVSMTFDEFYHSSADSLRERLKEFEQKILDSPGSVGLVVAFAAQQPQIDDGQKLISLAERVGTISKTDYKSKIFIRFGGYRLRETFVFIFRPQECSSYDMPIADFTADGGAVSGILT